MAAVPDDVWINVFRFMNVVDILNLSVVSKSLKSLISFAALNNCLDIDDFISKQNENIRNSYWYHLIRNVALYRGFIEINDDDRCFFRTDCI